MLELIKNSLALEVILMFRIVIDILITVVGNGQVNLHSRDKSNAMRFFLEGLIVDSEGSNGVQVDGDGSDLNIS
jgi:hypothetical protein